jgi:UDP-N-acetylglucosamine 4,6-dehydratase
MHAFSVGNGGEVLVPKIPSMRVTDLAEAICPDQPRVLTGIRPGEKLHECMITEDDARQTRDHGNYYIIYPDFPWYDPKDLAGDPVPDGFRYSSEINDMWLSVDELKGLAGL